MSGIWLHLMFLAGLSAAPAAGFQLQVTPLMQANGPHRTVTGTVINGVTGEPIRRALVQVNGLASASALTGADGRFQFEDIPEGTIVLYSQKPGYFDSRSLPGSQGNLGFTVGAGKNDFRLALFPAARIVGKITDTDGEAVENAPVSVLSEQIIDGRKQWQNRGSFTTDDEGSSQIDDLVPGRYIVLFGGHATPARSWNGPWDVSPPAYYPDGTDLASAQVIELRPGEIFRADFRVHRERGFNIKGTIVALPSGVMGGLSLWAPGGQTIQVGGMQFDPNKGGEFSIDGVPPGRWTLSFSANDNQGHSYVAKQEVAVGHADISNLQVPVFPMTSIPVVVNHAAKTDQSQQQPVNQGFFGTLVSQDSFNPMQVGIREQGDPPAPRFENVAPGKYRLRVVYGNECVESAWYGNVDLLNDYLVIGEGGGGAQPITVNMQATCATLNVHVQAKNQLKAGVILVIPSNPLQDAVVLPSGGQAAPWSPPLPPGSYEVYALSNIAGLEYANPEAMRGYPSQSVTLTAGEKADVTVEVTERKGN